MIHPVEVTRSGVTYNSASEANLADEIPGIYTAGFPTDCRNIAEAVIESDWLEALVAVQQELDDARDAEHHCTRHTTHDKTCLWCKSTAAQWRQFQLTPVQEAAIAAAGGLSKVMSNLEQHDPLAELIDGSPHG